jgi:nitroreductase
VDEVGSTDLRVSVSDAVARRYSARAFKPDPVPAATVRDILDRAARAPSGGNLQPWRAYALAGAPLDAFREIVAGKLADGGPDEPMDYEIYPKDLWDPYRTHRFTCGEDMYAILGIAREDRAGRLNNFARNYRFFGAPVGLFFTIERGMGRPQWADLGMFLQTVMLLAVERGLGVCAQECWARFPKTVTDFIGAPPEQMLFCGMAMGYASDAPINSLRTRRGRFEEYASLRGFET